MSERTVILKKLLSKATVDRLEAELAKGNIESLKKQLEKLFTFKKIFNLHDDHLIELAECIVDLSKAEDRMEAARAMKVYIGGRMARYQKRKEKAINEYQWAKAAKNPDKVRMLDLEHRMQVYENGFEHSRFQMYTMVSRIAEDIIYEAERNMGNAAWKY